MRSARAVSQRGCPEEREAKLEKGGRTKWKSNKWYANWKRSSDYTAREGRGGEGRGRQSDARASPDGLFGFSKRKCAHRTNNNKRARNSELEEPPRVGTEGEEIHTSGRR